MDSSYDILTSQFPPSSPSGSQSAAAIDAELATIGPDGNPVEPQGEGAPLSHYQPDETFRYEGTEARRSAAGKGAMVNNAALSWEEKKARQRDQNRLAAERSRAKKRKQQGNLEGVVGELENENARMRERLAQIKGSANGQSSPSAAAAISASHPPSTTSRDSINADNAFIRKMFNDLAGLKATLLDKEMELSNARNRPVAPENAKALQTLLVQKVEQFKLESEQAILRLLSDNLASEKDDIIQQRDHLGNVLALHGGSVQEGDEIDLAPWVHAAVQSIEESHGSQQGIDPTIE